MNTGLLSLLYLAGPTLPIGGFAYSQGLETAIERGWVRDEAGVSQWMRGVLKHGLGGLDLPVLLRMHAAAQAGDGQDIARWNDFILASRETSELLLEEIQLGKALRRLLADQGLLEGNDSPGFGLPEEPGYLAMFALAASIMGVEAKASAQGFAWSWAENQAAVACKTIPIGQTSAQRALLSLMSDIVEAVDAASRLGDDELGGSLPGLALSSSLHETQYSRLFRS